MLSKPEIERLRESCLACAKAFPDFSSYKNIYRTRENLEKHSEIWKVALPKCESTINRMLDLFKERNRSTKNIRIYTKTVDGLLRPIKKILEENWIPEEGFDAEDPQVKELVEKFEEVTSCLFSLHTLLKLFYEATKAKEIAATTSFRLKQPEPQKRIKKTTYKFEEWKQSECLKDFFKKIEPNKIEPKKGELTTVELKEVERDLLSKKELFGVVSHGIIITGWIGKQALEVLNSSPFQYEVSCWGRTAHHAIGLGRMVDGEYWLIKQALLLGTPIEIENHDQAIKFFAKQALLEEDWATVFKIAHLYTYPLRKKGKNYWIIIPRFQLQGSPAMNQLSIREWGLI